LSDAEIGRLTEAGVLGDHAGAAPDGAAVHPAW
jgi:hypothetical protein